MFAGTKEIKSTRSREYILIHGSLEVSTCVVVRRKLAELWPNDKDECRDTYVGFVFEKSE